jgi:hypothetical protein
VEWSGTFRRRFSRLIDALAGSGAHPRGEHLVRLATDAVLRESVLLHGSLVLPDEVTVRLPEHEYRQYSQPVLSEELGRAVRSRVRELTSPAAGDRPRRVRGATRITLTRPLRVRIVPGDRPAASARFSDGVVPSPTATPIGVAPGTWAPTVRLAEPAPTLPAAARPADPLVLVLRADRRVVGVAPAGPDTVTVGRRHDATLVVPENKLRISRTAASASWRDAGTLEVKVENRNGAWRIDQPAAGFPRPREPLGAGARTVLRPGTRLELDRRGTVALALERTPG